MFYYLNKNKQRRATKKHIEKQGRLKKLSFQDFLIIKKQLPPRQQPVYQQL